MSSSPELSGPSGLAASRPELKAGDWRRLNRLLAQGLEVDSAHRGEWIATLPDSDRDLLPLLARLLEQASTAKAWETAGAMPRLRSDALRMAASAAVPRIDEQPGDQIGPYRLLRELGSGGMGTVWLAERTDGVIERQVAIKLPRAEWTDRGLADRMARERSLLASLNHPNIAQLLDAGWAGDGRPYLALEYVDGEPIDAWCRRQQLAPAERARLFVDVVRAVAFAHAKLVIHRDLKPSNVLVTAEGRVKLLDFGIAKLLSTGAPQTEETALTQLSGRALTLNYAAPEQVLGQPISTAADTYSLGVMLFELLSGERPYRPARESRAALEDAIVNIDPPAPSSVAADKNKTAARALRGDLDTIILKALRKQPEQRYETAAAFADDLERWLDQRPVRAQPNSGWYRMRRFVARHRLGFVAGTVATSALLVGAGVALWQFRAANERLQNEVVQSLISLADPPTLYETRSDYLQLLARLERRVDDLGARNWRTLPTRVRIAKVYRDLGEIERASTTLRRAFAEAQEVLPSNDYWLAHAWIEIADWQVLSSEEVGPALDRAIATAQQQGERSVLLVINGLHKRSLRRLVHEGRRGDGLVDVIEAHAIAFKNLNAWHPVLLAATARLSDWLWEEGNPISDRLTLTGRAYKAALASDLGSSDPVFLEVQAAHARNLLDAGHLHAGREMLMSTLTATRQSFPQAVLPAERTFASLAVGLIAVGDIDGAVKTSQQAFALAAAREPAGTINRAMRADQVITMALLSRNIKSISPMLDEYSSYVSRSEASSQRDGARHWTEAKRVWLMNYIGDTVGAAQLAPQVIENATRMDWPSNARSARLGWSYALRQNGLPEEADRVLQPLSSGPRPFTLWEHEDILKERAAVELAIGDADQALSLANLAINRVSVSKLQADPYVSDLYLTRGQALLKLGRTAEARDAFRVATDFWDSYDAASHWSAEASYWLARALIETGDSATGRPMLEVMQARLAKSPMPLHRALAKPASLPR